MEGGASATEKTEQTQETRSGAPAKESAGLADLDVPEMLDILYDFVAAGVAPTSGAELALVERFLHEHAREPKTAEAFRSFLAEHGIEPRAVTEPRVPIRLLEPMPLVEANVVDSGGHLVPTGGSGVRALQELQGPGGPPAMVATLIQSPPARFFGLLALGVLLSFVSLLVFGIFTVQQLRVDLAQTRSRAELAELGMHEQREQVAAMSEALAAQRAQLERLEKRSEVLGDGVQALLVAEEQDQLEDDSAVRRRARRRAAR